MASTLVVETGLGLSNSDSYISATDANSYVAAYGNSSTWSAASEADKDDALRRAAQYIDIKYRFKGYRANQTQAMAWPRSSSFDLGVSGGYVRDEDGYAIETTTIPMQLKRAQVEIAKAIIDGDDPLAALSNPGVIQSETKKIGVLEKSVTYVGGRVPQKSYPKVDALLRPLLANSTLMQRG